MRNTFKSRIAGFLATLSMLLMVSGAVTAQEASPVSAPTALESAVAWLLTQQADDGGFIGFTGESDTSFTIDGVMALVAANNVGIDTGDAVERAVTFLGASDNALVFTQTGPGQAAKLILGLLAAGVNPEGFANVMPLSIVEKGQNSETGIYGTGLYDHAYAMLALSALDEEIPTSALDALANTQSESGGWAFDGSIDPASVDSNTTSMIIQALVASGNSDNEMLTNALSYLSTVVTADGAAYSEAEGTPADSNSTALVAQAYLATGGDASGLEASLLTFQKASGSLFYMADDSSDNAFSTVQAIPAMAGQALPILPVTGEANSASFATLIAWHELAAA